MEGDLAWGYCHSQRSPSTRHPHRMCSCWLPLAGTAMCLQNQCTPFGLVSKSSEMTPLT